jgi:hypothetical protein
MSKKRRDSRIVNPSAIDERVIATEQPKPRAFVPRDCPACRSLRPAGSNYSRVYSKHGDVRYCRCDFCGNTWSQYYGNVAIAVATEDIKPVSVVISCTDGISGEPSSTD